MEYKMSYDGEADVLSLIISEDGELSHAEEAGDLVIHFSKDGKPLFIEILRASKIIPLMVEALAKKESVVT